MKNIIEVNGIKIYANHGCLKEETAIGGHYVVDVKITTDFLSAAKNDDLQQTIDYVLVNNIVKEEMEVPAKLIEAVGLRIFNRIKNTNNAIEKISVKLTKICPPINGDVENVAIVIED